MFSRFYRYIDKVFDFSDEIAGLKDCRLKPQIPTASIWLSAFAMFFTRRPSLNAIETLLRIPRRLDSLIGCRWFSRSCADTDILSQQWAIDSN